MIHRPIINEIPIIVSQGAVVGDETIGQIPKMFPGIGNIAAGTQKDLVSVFPQKRKALSGAVGDPGTDCKRLVDVKEDDGHGLYAMVGDAHIFHIGDAVSLMEIPVGTNVDCGNLVVAFILFTVQIVQSNAANIQ